jgi:hypothetical protein
VPPELSGTITMFGTVAPGVKLRFDAVEGVELPGITVR